MSKRLLIIGAGGHGKVVADIALKCGYENICFADDSSVGYCMDFPIIGKSNELSKFDDGQTEFVIAIGNNALRKNISEQYPVNWISLVHPSAQIGYKVKIDVGTVVMANAVINPGAVIGKHCIINTGAVIEHDNVLKDYVHISPRAVLGGTVTVGELTHVGVGATVKNNMCICDNCIIGAGATVVKNIENSGIYVGVPAKKTEDK